MRKLLILCFTLFATINILAQGFTNVTTAMGIDVNNATPTLGYGVSFFDFNNDGWDDLSFCQEEDSLIFYMNDNGTFVQMPSLIYAPDDAKMVLWADYDNDGDNDLLMTQYLGPTQLLRNDGDLVFTDVSFSSGIPQAMNVKSFGASWADYDRDGLLDLYICNYNWNDGITNWCMHNNGDGTFTDVAETLGIDNGSNPSYQSAWVDINHDGWADLYVINDFLPANAMYLNNGDGTFTDISAGSGLDIHIEAMCNSWNDYDNDGDLDVYVSNVQTGNYLLRNNGNNTFSNEALNLNVQLNHICWGSLWIDYNNDGWDDLHVATTFGESFINQFFANSNGTFALSNELGFSGDQTLSYSNAKGDFNNDGFYDLIVTNISSVKSYLYENQGIGDNYLKVDLKGTYSNEQAVGSWVTHYIDGESWTEYTQCGDNFASQNSQHLILPAGDANTIDSLVIEWPRGLVETYYDLDVNQSVTFIEGSQFAPIVQATNSLEWCLSDNLELYFDQEFESIVWNTGATTPTLQVDSAGIYFAEVTNEDGYVFLSNSVEVIALESAQIEEVISDNLCFGDENASIEIIATGVELTEILWNTGADTTIISGLQGGEYIYEGTDANGCMHSGTIIISSPDEITYSFETSDPTCYGSIDGSVIVNPSGGTGDLLLDFGGQNPDEMGAGTWPVEITDGNGCTLEFDIELVNPDSLWITQEVTASNGDDGEISISINGGTGDYTILWSNGDQNVLAIDQLAPGIYTVWIIDENDCALFAEFEVEAIIGISESTAELFQVFPNPAHQFITISHSGSSPLGFSLYATDGRLVLPTRVQGTTQLDISSLVPGLYHAVAISDKGERSDVRLIIQ
ncbi:MAG: VCBS repeat-containing protein [Flavobacteriales bacterium]|nr:VCBS repeat-containing protein [Flavobacteriales bacterium]